MTDFIPKYSPEQRALQKKLQEGIDKMHDQIAKARGEWTDRIMEAILPDALYVAGKAKNCPERKKIARWLRAKNIRFKEWPDRSEIVRGDEIIGRFFATFKNGKLEVEASIKKGLLAASEQAQSPNSATENPPVVPPSDPTDASPDKGGAS